MTFDNLITIACLVLAVVAYGGYRFFSRNVWLRFKSERRKFRWQNARDCSHRRNWKSCAGQMPKSRKAIG